jgi:hypothetical protein
MRRAATIVDRDGLQRSWMRRAATIVDREWLQRSWIATGCNDRGSRMAALDEAAALFDDVSLPRPFRLRSLWTMALSVLRCSKEHHLRVARIELGMLTARPADAAEAGAWMKGTTKVVTAPGLGLPVRAASGF